MKIELVHIVATLENAIARISAQGEPSGTILDGFGCEYSPELAPLIEMLGTFIELGYIFGILAGTLSLTYAGIIMIIGNPDQVEEVKRRVRSVIIGIVIILSATSIIAFIVAQSSACDGGF